MSKEAADAQVAEGGKAEKDRALPYMKLGKAPEIEAEETHFGRYLLGYRLAAGGMASVYLGRMVSTGGFFKPVVVKCMHPHLSEKDDYVAMFRDEAQITARISHANVVPLVDFGQIEGKWFMALEYFAGLPMSRVIGHTVKNHASVETETWQTIIGKIIADAAEGLHAAHEICDDRGASLGVVHRDVSPQNIMVGSDGTVRVIDFGVATSRGRLHETAPGVLKGKFAYMAPEQLFDRTTNRRADIWALGVCLWEGLTGRRLFKGKDLRKIATHIKEGPIPAPSRLSPTVSKELDEVTLKALTRDPEKRYQTAREFSSALRAAFPDGAMIDSTEKTAEWLKEHCASDLERQQGLVRELADREDMEASTVVEFSFSESGEFWTKQSDGSVPDESAKVKKETSKPNRIPGAPSVSNPPPAPPGQAANDSLSVVLSDGSEVTLGIIAKAAARWMTNRSGAVILIAVGVALGLALTFILSSGGPENSEANAPEVPAADLLPAETSAQPAAAPEQPAPAPEPQAEEPQAAESEPVEPQVEEPAPATVAPSQPAPRRPWRRRPRQQDRVPANPF